MKKAASFLVFVSLLATMSFPSMAGAQTSVDANLKKVQELMTQIKALQEQIAGLQKKQTELSTSANQAIIEIVSSLKQGSEGDEVRVLQTLLSLDSALYPEGLITGYYGQATRKAIERFQKKHGLEAVGFVGPKTKKELNKLIREQFKIVEDLEKDIDDDISEEVERAIASITLPALPSDRCGIPSLPIASTTPFIQKDGKTKIIQTGNVFIYKDGKHKIIITPNSYHEKDGKRKLLITPGMRMEKDGKIKTIIPCNGATTTPPISNDNTPPIISAILASPTHQSATITWITNEPATGKIYYGTTSPLNLQGANNLSNSTLQTGHSFSLRGLLANTVYYFVLESKDKKGNVATSSQQSFTTSNTPDTQAPVITAISITNMGTSSAKISWTTNENSNSKVYFGTTTPINTISASTKSDSSMVTNHAIDLSLLNPGSTYYFKVESSDASNNVALSSETVFATTPLPPADTIAPSISAIFVSPASTTAQVSWTTNEAATSKVYYGLVSPLILGSALNVFDGTFLGAHSLGLSGLAASTTYYYVVESKDASNNTSNSTEASFVTSN